MHRTLGIGVQVLAAALAVTIVGGSTAGAVAFVVGAVAAELAERHRAHRLSAFALDDFGTFLVRGIVIGALATVAGFAVSGRSLPGVPAAAAPVVAATLYAVLAVIGLAIGYAILRQLRSRHRLTSRAVIVGADPVGMELDRRLREHPEYGIAPIGVVDRARDLSTAIDVEHVEYVFVASGAVTDNDLVDVLRVCDRAACEVRVVPRLFDLGTGGPAVDHMWGIPLVRLNRTAYRWRSWTKRIFDICFTAAALALTAPLLAAIALAVRTEIGPKILFRQVRLGLDGRPFILLKFRTLPVQSRDSPPAWSGVTRDQTGPVGRFLRRTSLDELPQFWNVLRGDMSVVGPRPEQPQYVAQFMRSYPEYRDRLRAPAGVTGWSQINGLRGGTSIEDRVRFDNFYIDHWSLWLDIKIIIRTVTSVVAMRGS